jgi:hypothetical protein
MASGAVLWVQQVDVTYTKASRGAPGAARRNALPRAFAMHVAGDAPFAFERYVLRERDGFVPVRREAATSASAPGRQNGLTLSAAAGRVTVGLRWSPFAGRPPRRPVPRALELYPGQTARLFVNARHASYAGQWYAETTYNVAFGPALAPDAFTAARPGAQLDLRANLFLPPQPFGGKNHSARAVRSSSTDRPNLFLAHGPHGRISRPPDGRDLLPAISFSCSYQVSGFWQNRRRVESRSPAPSAFPQPFFHNQSAPLPRGPCRRREPCATSPRSRRARPVPPHAGRFV